MRSHYPPKFTGVLEYHCPLYKLEVEVSNPQCPGSFRWKPFINLNIYQGIEGIQHWDSMED